MRLSRNKKDKEDFIDIFCKDINKVQFFFNESYMNNSVRLEKIKVLNILILGTIKLYQN